jgi:DUF4097 and DUF4098 domain-containing protein YvlB
MLRSAHFRALAALAVLAPAGCAQDTLTREGPAWVRTIRGTVADAHRLRVRAQGPVTLEGGGSRSLSYTLRVSANVRTESEARRILGRYWVRAVPQGGWIVLTVSSGEANAALTIQAPRLSAAEIAGGEGVVVANGIDGPLTVVSRAGPVFADRIRGNSRLMTGGGEIRVGRVQGSLESTTGAGHITVQSAAGEAVLRTNGGDIVATVVGGPVRAETLGGSVRIGSAGGPVTAVTGGGQITIGKANGLVTARNMAGPVHVGSAAGVRCESGNGGIHLGGIAGSMQATTAWGSIFASLMGGRVANSVLATRNGDITVTIPSNVGVTIRAENVAADTVKRIVSEFPGIPIRLEGMRVVAEGPVNGGGPLLQISDTGGTIFIRRQR